MDMWGIGCVMFETLSLFPLFPGANEADQIERIHKVRPSPLTHTCIEHPSGRAETSNPLHCCCPASYATVRGMSRDSVGS